MNNLLQALQDHRFATEAVRHPIVWSEAAIQYLREVSSGSVPTGARIDVELAKSLRKCAEGSFAEAEIEILALLYRDIEVIEHDGETFISALYAAFVVQRLDIVAALLRDRYGYGRGLEIAVQADDGPGRHRVRWEVLPSGTHRFTFDAGTYQHDNTRLDILTFQWEFPVYTNYSYSDLQPVGAVIINQGDVGQSPGLAWSESRPDFFLIPDCVFVPSGGHAHIHRATAKHYVPWEAKKPIAFWRGATTGIPDEQGNWRTLERVRLCEIARRYEHTGLIDAGLSEIKQISDPGVITEIEHSGLIRGYVPWEDWSQYKYLIEIDGNCNSWSNLFQRLLTGSAVLRVESARGLRQWFYDELVPWQNYIPIAPNMYDLMAKIEWLTHNDEFAQKIGQAGRALAERLTYDRELARSANTILQCFQYFNGPRYNIKPFGQVTP